MEHLKTKLIEDNNEEFSVDIREEYVALKDIRNKFIIDLTNNDLNSKL